MRITGKATGDVPNAETISLPETGSAGTSFGLLGLLVTFLRLQGTAEPFALASVLRTVRQATVKGHETATLVDAQVSAV